MRELREILHKIDEFAPDEKAILATVVDVKGSSYRRAGARMLIDRDGNSIGTVSGGCLEADVLERAKKVFATGEPTVITYDTTENENSVFGLGMGCRGVIRVLLERVERKSYLFEIIRTALDERRPQLIATLIWAENDLRLGRRVYCDETEEFGVEDFHVWKLDHPLFEDCRKIFDERQPTQSKIYDSDKGKIEIFFEIIAPPVNLILFGAGYDAIPLADLAADLDWRVTVVDHRAAWANADRFPHASEIIVSRAENLKENLNPDENSVAVIMTHNYEADREILLQTLNSNCAYIGALGPKKRTENLLDELRAAGKNIKEENLSKLYAPVGLDIGADTPEEIALSIIAEIKTVLAKRNGGFLRERKGGIH